MPRFKTFANSGTLLTSDLNSIQDDYETQYATYLDLWRTRTNQGLSSSNAAGTYVVSNTFGFTVLTAPPQVWGSVFHFDPADYAAPSRVLKLRLRAHIAVNAVAPAINFVMGLYPLGSIGGAPSALPTIGSLGTVISGSTVTYNAPSLSTQQHNNSGDFTAPAAGYYVFAFTTSGTPAANSRTNLNAMLQMRNV